MAFPGKLDSLDVLGCPSSLFETEGWKPAVPAETLPPSVAGAESWQFWLIADRLHVAPDMFFHLQTILALKLSRLQMIRLLCFPSRCVARRFGFRKPKAKLRAM